MAASDLSSFINYLKIQYREGLNNYSHYTTPFLTWVPKKNRWGGESQVLSVGNTTPESPQPTKAQAIAKYNGSNNVRWTMNSQTNVISLYQDIQIKNKDWAMAKDKHAFAEMKMQEMLGAERTMMRTLELQMLGNGDGVLSQISSGHTTATITLTDRRHAIRFRKNQDIVASTTRNGGTAKTAYKVQSVSKSAGTVTFTAATTGWAANDYLFVENLYDTGANPENFTLNPYGLQSFLPLTRPAAGAASNLYGVTRSDHDDHMIYGHLNATYPGTMTEALEDITDEMILTGDLEDEYICLLGQAPMKKLRQETDINKFSSLINEQRDVLKGIANITFQSANGVKIPLVVNPNLDADRAYILKRSAVAWEGVDGKGFIHVPDLVEEAHGPITNEDGHRFPLRNWGNLLVRTPSDCAVFKTE